MLGSGEIAGHLLMAYNFKVVVAEKTMSFAEVSGLARQHDTVTYRHGLSFWEGERIAKYPNDKHVTVTLKRGTLVSGGVLLYAWLETKEEVPMTISLCDERGLPVIQWKIRRALPVKLSAPTFDASSSQVSIDTLEVMAAGITIDAAGR